MMKFVIKVAQNGGEYYGYTTIKGNTIEKNEGNTVVVDGVEITFDEYIEVVSIKNL